MGGIANQELMDLCGRHSILRSTKCTRPEWPIDIKTKERGRVVKRISENRAGRRKVVRLRLRWMECVENDLS